MTHPDLLTTLAGIGVASLTCQWVAWRIGVPAILFLLGAGILAGPVTGLLNPDLVFGELLFPFVSIAVAIVLFEGSLTLRFDEIREHGAMVRNLVSIGTAVAWVVGSVAARLILDLSWPIALLFGALVVVTGPTVIQPLLRSMRLKAKLANILRWEAIVIDPIGALLVVLIYEAIASTHGNGVEYALFQFGKSVALGTGLGLAGAFSLAYALRHHIIPHYLQNAVTLTFMLGLFALSNHFVSESGLLLVTVMGIMMANIKGVPLDDILEFKESLSVLLISALFIILAARIDFAAILSLGAALPVLLLVLIIVGRPLSVFVSAHGQKLDMKEKLYLSWVAPRGIIAAAVSSLIALQLEQLNYPGADLLVPLVFIVIIVTVILQSVTARPMARLLGLVEPESNGFLIIGANPFVRDLATVVQKREVPVMLTDTNWDNVRLSRMKNLPVYYGNPLSEHAENNLDLSRTGNVLVLSPYRNLNSLATYHFIDLLGANKVFTLSDGEHEASARHQVAGKILQTRGLFGEGITYAKLASLVSQGATIKTTTLREAFGFADYLAQYGNRALPLIAIDPKGKLMPFQFGRKFDPVAGWEIISLVQPEVASDSDKAATSVE